MKKNLIHAAAVLLLLAGFTSTVFAQWVQTDWPATSTYFDLYSNQNTVIARTWDIQNGGRTFLTADNGTDWTQIAAVDSSTDIVSLVIQNDTILAGTWNGLINATVGSTNWTALTPAGIPADSVIFALGLVNSTLYAGSMGTVYTSSDNGGTWAETTTGIPADARITCFDGTDDAVFAGTTASGVYLSTDAGASWTAINTGLDDLHIAQIVTNGGTVYAVTLKGGAYSSDNNGTSWTKIDLPGINCLVAVGGRLYAGTDYTGMYLSYDDGGYWEMVDTGLPVNTRIFSMAATDDNLFAGTSDGVWRAPVESIITSIEDTDTPELYVLERNFPNPFNPTTTIGFSIPVQENVTLTIYNVTGQKIRTLVDAPMSAGAHQVVWNGLTDAGAHAPSGVYMYELRAGIFRDTKKLLMMK